MHNQGAFGCTFVNDSNSSSVVRVDNNFIIAKGWIPNVYIVDIGECKQWKITQKTAINHFNKPHRGQRLKHQ